MTLSQPDRLDRIEALVEANARAIAELKQESQQLDKRLEENVKRLEEDAKRWDERFFQINRDYGQTSRAIIYTIGTVVIFSPVIRVILTPLFDNLATRLLE
jgi:regulator of extracellular matrix RemA (YlzA/DUF370 family)